MVRCLLPSLSTRPLSEPSRESKSCECGVEIGGEEGLKWTILLFVCLCLLCLFINLFVSRIIIVIIMHDGVFFCALRVGLCGVGLPSLQLMTYILLELFYLCQALFAASRRREGGKAREQHRGRSGARGGRRGGK